MKKKEITKQQWLDYITALIAWVDIAYPDVNTQDEGSNPPPPPPPPPVNN